MGKYMHYFQTESEFNQERSENYIEPWVSLTGDIERVDYNKTEDERLFETPFTIEVLGDGNISWKLGDKSVQYSKNGGEWATMTSATTIPVVQGDEVQFKGMNTDYINYTNNNISSTAQFNVKGNIMSLTNGDNFVGADSVGTNAFKALFSGCTAVTSAENLKLPATTLAPNCYQYMFADCTSLTTAPVLSATTLANYCYQYMFQGCTSLTTAPELPATVAASSCYSSMFNGCTSLTTAPELPATTLANYCYDSMFSGCTSLTTAPELPATALTSYCYQSMFRGCTSLNYIKAMFIQLTPTNATGSWVSGVAANGTFVKNSAATWTTTGISGVPRGWTVQTANS